MMYVSQYCTVWVVLRYDEHIIRTKLVSKIPVNHLHCIIKNKYFTFKYSVQFFPRLIIKMKTCLSLEYIPTLTEVNS